MHYQNAIKKSRCKTDINENKYRGCFFLNACGLVCVNGGFFCIKCELAEKAHWNCTFFSSRPFLPLVLKKKKLKANWRAVLHDKLRPLLSTHLLKFSSKCSPQQELCVLLAWVITFISLHRQVWRPYIHIIKSRWTRP